MESSREAYHPNEEERIKAESLLTEIQRIQSEMREELYEQFSENQRQTFSDLMAKGASVMRVLKEKGILDRPAADVLREYLANLDRVKKGESVSTPALDAIREQPEFKETEQAKSPGTRENK